MTRRHHYKGPNEEKYKRPLNKGEGLSQSAIPKALRKKVGSRTSSSPTATYNDEQREFLKAIQELKKQVGPHPTDEQVFGWAWAMGYRPLTPMQVVVFDQAQAKAELVILEKPDGT